MKAICVDVDGTLAEYNGNYTFNQFGLVIENIRSRLCDFKKQGYRIFIQTTRSWAEYEALRNWLKNNDVPCDEIIMGSKPIAFAYLDDRAVNPTFQGWEDKLEHLLGNPFKLGEDKRDGEYS